MSRWLTWLCLPLNLQTLTGCSSAPRLPDVADKVGAASKLVVPMSRDALTFLQAERDRESLWPKESASSLPRRSPVGACRHHARTARHRERSR